MKKWFLSLVFALIICLGLMPGTALAAEGDVALSPENFPDQIFRDFLTQNYDKNTDGVLSAAEIRSVTMINCSGMEVSDVTGVGYLTALKNFYCTHNRLTELDLSKNNALVKIGVNDNQLESIRLPKTESLQEIICGDNRLTELDLSGIPNLTKLECHGNQLMHLDLSKQTKLKTLTYKGAARVLADGAQLPDKFDLDRVDSVEPSNAFDGGRVHFDETGRILYEYNCGNPGYGYLSWSIVEAGIAIDEVNFPDRVFRDNYVTPWDSNRNGQLSPEEIAGVKRMNFGIYSGITSLKGLEYFTELTSLECSNIPIYDLDLSHKTKLETLTCSYCSLKELDLSMCPQLKKLNCQSNQSLSRLDISMCPNLEEITCSNCALSELDLSDRSSLQILSCDNMKTLTRLDVSGCTGLKELSCIGSRLTEVNVSGCSSLEMAEFESNRLTKLDLSGCGKLTWLNCKDNHLTSLDLSANSLPEADYIVSDENGRTVPDGGAITDWLPGFDRSKASNIQGGSLDNGVVRFTDNTLTYSYAANSQLTVTFTLTRSTHSFIGVGNSSGSILVHSTAPCTLVLAAYQGKGQFAGIQTYTVSRGDTELPSSLTGNALRGFFLNENSCSPLCEATVL